jgi:hypothetical protein
MVYCGLIRGSVLPPACNLSGSWHKIPLSYTLTRERYHLRRCGSSYSSTNLQTFRRNVLLQMSSVAKWFNMTSNDFFPLSSQKQIMHYIFTPSLL